MATTFVKFSLQDKNGQAIIGIDDGALQQSLIVEIKNPANDKSISIKPLEDEKNYHFRLNFRPGTLLESNLDKVNLSTKNIQEKWELKKEKGAFIFTYKGEANAVIAANGSLMFTLENVSAEPEGGARGTRVELDYRNLFYTVDEQNLFSGTLLQYINVVNQRGNQQIPLHIGFTGSDKVEQEETEINVGNKIPEEKSVESKPVKISKLRVVGSNRILNDGTPNELLLSFRHLQKNPFQKKENEIGLSVRGTDKYNDGATNFKISFDVLPKESAENISRMARYIQYLVNNTVEYVNQLLEGQTDLNSLQANITLLVKEIGQAKTFRWQDIKQADLDTYTHEPENIQSSEGKKTQEISNPTLDLNKLPSPVQKIANLIGHFLEGSEELDKLSQKLTNIDNSQEKQQILTDIKTIAELFQDIANLIVAWKQRLPEDTREALLCASDASKIAIEINKEYFKKDWEIKFNSEGASPQWTITRLTTVAELTDEILRLEIKNIITKLPVGYGNLYVYYENIPGYWDGYVICPIEKGPLMFRKDGQGDESLGIGTNKPEAKLHVFQEGLTNVAVFEGKSGVAIKGAEGKHNALWITDTQTEYPALYVEQKGKGEVAYFGGKVQIQGSLNIVPLSGKNLVNYIQKLRQEKVNKFVGLDEISQSLGADISLSHLSDAEVTKNSRLYLSNNPYLRITNSKILEEFRTKFKELDYGAYNIHESQRVQTFDKILRENLWNQKDFLRINVQIKRDESIPVTIENFFGYFTDKNYQNDDYNSNRFKELLYSDRDFINFLSENNGKNLCLRIAEMLEHKIICFGNGTEFKDLVKDLDQNYNYIYMDIATLPSYLKNFFSFTEAKITEIFINGKPLSSQEKILIAYDLRNNNFHVHIFNKDLEQNDSLKDQLYAVNWEKLAEDPRKVFAVKGVISSSNDNILGLDLGNNTGLKYDQSTKKLGIWVDSEEQLQIASNSINVPNGNFSINVPNGNFGVGTGASAPSAKLHIEGTLRIGSRHDQNSRQMNKIVIGDGENVQIGEWEEDDVLSLKATKRISCIGDVKVSGGISCGGKIAIKSSRSGRYLSDVKDTSQSYQEYARFMSERRDCEEFTLEMACSRDIKENIVSLTGEEALSTITQLNAVKYDYKDAHTFRPNLGFIAEEMPDNLASADRKTLSPFEVIPVLTKVVQEQQQKIEALQIEIAELQKKLNLQ